MRISDWSSDVCSSDLPVGRMDVHARHHQAHVDERRTEEPIEPGTPVLVERDHYDREHHAHHQRALDQAFVAARASPGGHGVAYIDDVLAAPDRETLDHAALPDRTNSVEGNRVVVR